MLAILGLCIWMVRRPHAKEPYKIILLILFFAFEPFSTAVMHAENRGFPLKFDYFLYTIDQSLGVSAFWVARLLSDWQRQWLLALYQSLSVAMIAWYGVNLKRRGGKPGKLLIAYLVAFLVGPCLYLIVPACGPRHAFGTAFPMGDPVVSPVLISLNYLPNAIPSLHVATALLFVFFAGRNVVLKTFAWVYLAGTVVSTLAFEHYVIDLVLAVPFACFATRMAEGKWKPALAHFTIVLAWLVAIRFATPTLIGHPGLLRLLALLTVGWASLSMVGDPEPDGHVVQPASVEVSG